MIASTLPFLDSHDPSITERSETSKSFEPYLGQGFVESFISAFSIIAVSEIGDKTFFMAAIFAMKYSRLVVFFGSLSALALMTVLSAFLGYATTILSRRVTTLVSSLLFMVFGLKMFHEGYNVEPDEAMKDFQDVREELEKKQEVTEVDPSPEDLAERGAGTARDRTVQHERLFRSFFSSVFVQSFILTFLAEWGDRSQLSTVMLAAKSNFAGVLLGGTFGHALCTGSAVLAGRYIAQRVSLKTVHYVGGLVFIASGFYSLIPE